MSIHPIEAESYRILAERVDLDAWPPLARHVVARMIHASADLDFAETARCTDAAVRSGIDAVRVGAPLICDSEMVRTGVSGVDAMCFLAAVEAPMDGTTRTAASRMRRRFSSVLVCRSAAVRVRAIER